MPWDNFEHDGKKRDAACRQPIDPDMHERAIEQARELIDESKCLMERLSEIMDGLRTKWE